MTLLSVPVIDIAPYWTGGERGKREVAAAVDRACRDIGFLVISGHGVSPELVEETRDLTRAFFDLPLDEKLRVAQPASNVSRGYTPLESEAVARSRGQATAAGDLNESFMVGPVDALDGAYATTPAAGQHFAPNLWPDRPAELRPVFTRYYRAMSELAQVLMRLFALGLGLARPSSMPRSIITSAVFGFATIRHRLQSHSQGSCAQGAFRLRKPDHSVHRGQARRTSSAQCRRRLGGRPRHPRLLHREFGRPDGPLDQRRLDVDAPPRRQSTGRCERREPAPIARVLSQPELRRRCHLHSHLPETGRGTEIFTDNIRGAPAAPVRSDPDCGDGGVIAVRRACKRSTQKKLRLTGGVAITDTDPASRLQSPSRNSIAGAGAKYLVSSTVIS
jgi:hypothetical protein